MEGEIEEKKRKIGILSDMKEGMLYQQMEGEVDDRDAGSIYLITI